MLSRQGVNKVVEFVLEVLKLGRTSVIVSESKQSWRIQLCEGLMCRRNENEATNHHPLATPLNALYWRRNGISGPKLSPDVYAHMSV